MPHKLTSHPIPAECQQFIANVRAGQEARQQGKVLQFHWDTRQTLGGIVAFMVTQLDNERVVSNIGDWVVKNPDSRYILYREPVFNKLYERV